MNKRFLAFDLGAESGRGVIADFDGAMLSLHTVGRFSTSHNIGKSDPSGTQHWNYSEIVAHMRAILRHCEEQSPVKLSGVAVDSWGVDFALIGDDGKLLENPVWYRDQSHSVAMDRAVSKLTAELLWVQSGIQPMPFNTLFQLMARQSRNENLLEDATRLQFMPDLLSEALQESPVPTSELTIASTSQMLDPLTHQWNHKLLSIAGLPTHFLQEIVPPGTANGFTPGHTPIISVAGHDTASAVAAVPVGDQKNWAFISSGTWSLVGVERNHPELSYEALQLGLSNEKGVEGTTRLLKNIMGLWLVQECRRSLTHHNEIFSYEQLTALAAASPADGPVVDAADQRFLAPTDMPTEIRRACVDSGQNVPETVGALIRCCLDSLALAYRRTLTDIETLLDIQFDVIHIVGGGSKNKLLNRLTADACGIPVIAGPDEATAAGNALCQLIGTGVVSGWREARQICHDSFTPTVYVPHSSAKASWRHREELMAKAIDEKLLR